MKIIILVLFILLVPFANAGDTQFEQSIVSDAWSYPSKDGDLATPIYMVINNKRTTTEYLLSAETDIAERVEIRTLLKEENLFGSKEIQVIEIPAQSKLSISPRDETYQIRLIGLKEPLALGRRFWVSLRFEHAGPTKVLVPVEKTTHIVSIK